MRPKRANCSVSSRCLGKHSTPRSPSALRICLKSPSETGWARSRPSILAPNVLTLECVRIPLLGSSIYMRPRRLDDRRPFRQFRLDECSRLLRRTARRWIDAGLLQPLEHHRIGERLVYGLAEAIDDRLRHVPGGPHFLPSLSL